MYTKILVTEINIIVVMIQCVVGTIINDGYVCYLGTIKVWQRYVDVLVLKEKPSRRYKMQPTPMQCKLNIRSCASEPTLFQ